MFYLRSELAQVDVTTWKGVTHRVVLPLTFEMGELLSALGSKMWKCASCPTCKLQQSSMEIWTVNESGTGRLAFAWFSLLPADCLNVLVLVILHLLIRLVSCLVPGLLQGVC